MGSIKRKPHILVAEDESSIGDLLRLILERCGFAVTIAENGEEAFSEWKGGKFDLILMDIRMPVLDGCSASQMIRSHENSQGWQPIPIVALTATAQTIPLRLREVCMFSEVISKPMKTKELCDILHRLTES